MQDPALLPAPCAPAPACVHRQPHAFIDQHLGDEGLDALEIDVASRQRGRIDDEEGLPDARRVAFVDEERRASKPKRAPVSAVTSSSTTSASIAPLGLLAAPIGSIEPSSPAFGSVVGIAIPVERPAFGNRLALPFAATMSLPRATSDSDRSIISASASRRGNTAATGLVPNTGCLPPGGRHGGG